MDEKKRIGKKKKDCEKKKKKKKKKDYKMGIKKRLKFF